MSYKFTFSLTIKLSEGGDSDCAICLERDGGRWKKLDCNHSFHQTCIDRYLSTTDNQRCPICRRPIENGCCVS
jgi:hypothetical protein